VDRAKKLLEKTDAAKELEKIISELQQGKISSDDAQQQLSDLRQEIDGGNLELNNILDGLTSMANQLGQSDALASTAQAMAKGDAAEAAEQIRSLAEKLGITPEDVIREMQKNMSLAANKSPASLQDLSKSMKDASDALKNEDPQAGKIALDNLAQALDQVAQKMKGQQQQSQASQQLADLQNSLQQEAAADAAGAEAQLSPIPSQGQGGGGESGDSSPNGTPSAGNSSGNGQGSQSANSNSSAFGSPEDLKPGEMTKLDVQLKMEGLKGLAGKSGQQQDLEEASKQERSAMDYRNVPSQLSPAQKDALNQNRLPREQREIVKYYFEEIRPRATATAPTK
jgi:archaellum component FlaC